MAAQASYVVVATNKGTKLAKKFGKLFNVLIVLNYLTVCFSCYWVVKYIVYVNNSLRHEYLIGAIMSIWLTLPVWLSLAILGVIRKMNISKSEFIHYEVPFFLQVLLIVFIYSPRLF